MSAILLPLTDALEVDWNGFRAHVQRTLDAGLVPAVNMDTGFAHLINEQTRSTVLQETQQICNGRPFAAGAFVSDRPGDPFNGDRYKSQFEAIQAQGGTPVVFQSFGLTEQSEESLIASYTELATEADRFIAFELGTMFAPFGCIYSIETYRRLIQIPECIGAKHSSLDRTLEWQRLAVRDEVRPEFHVFTGNDLAIDMVMYGSDYLLGLSTMAPDLFALRDRFWESGNPDFFHLNDWLQYLGFLTFRSPVPAYKHSAAQFLNLRGWIESDRTFPGSPERPQSDREILATLLSGLDQWCSQPALSQ